MKQVVIILLLLIFVKPAISQNEDLIREVERHILWVDSLIVCCRDSLVVFNESIFVSGGRGGGSEVTYWTGDNPMFLPFIECDLEREKEWERFDRTKILNWAAMFNLVGIRNIEERTSFRNYYKNGELVAIRREWARGSLQNYTLSRMTIFINNNEIIFFQREGRVRNWRRVKAEIRERYNLR